MYSLDMVPRDRRPLRPLIRDGIHTVLRPALFSNIWICLWMILYVELYRSSNGGSSRISSPDCSTVKAKWKCLWHLWLSTILKLMLFNCKKAIMFQIVENVSSNIISIINIICQLLETSNIQIHSHDLINEQPTNYDPFRLKQESLHTHLVQYLLASVLLG